MKYFQYINGELFIEGVAISKIASEIGTPFYCYSSTKIESEYKDFSDAFSKINSTICYSVKANSNLSVIRTLSNLGAGADVVSGGELLRALKGGVSPKKIVFSGVGKTDQELEMAIESDILQINAESLSELSRLNVIAEKYNKIPKVGIRVNPDVEAGSHDKISTGRKEDKFGIDWENVREIFVTNKNFKNIKLVGLAIHIGSQLQSLSPFDEAFKRLEKLLTTLMSENHKIETIDLGGGLGIDYSQDLVLKISEYSKLVTKYFGNYDCNIIFEPGRRIVGNAGILIAQVICIKPGIEKQFVVLDAAMNDLLRPSLYGAIHEIIPITNNGPKSPKVLADIVGPICETGDTFATGIKLTNISEGDLVAINSAGAYGAVMSSFYNSRPLIAEVMVKDNDFEIVRKKLDISSLLNYESLPNWIKN